MNYAFSPSQESRGRATYRRTTRSPTTKLQKPEFRMVVAAGCRKSNNPRGVNSFTTFSCRFNLRTKSGARKRRFRTFAAAKESDARVADRTDDRGGGGWRLARNV